MNYTINLLAFCSACRNTKVIKLSSIPDDFAQICADLADEKVCPHYGQPHTTPISLYIENEEGDSYDVI